MTFSFDGEPEVDLRTCDQCGAQHEAVVGFVLRDDVAYAVYWASVSPHHRGALMDVTLGSWQEPDYPDQVTFGCRITSDDENLKCTLVQAGPTLSDSAIIGRKLDREAALSHPWLKHLWDVIDWLVENDPTLKQHVLEA